MKFPAQRHMRIAAILAAAIGGAIALPSTANAQQVVVIRGSEGYRPIAGRLTIDCREFVIYDDGAVATQVAEAFRCAGYSARAAGSRIHVGLDCQTPSVTWVNERWCANFSIRTHSIDVSLSRSAHPSPHHGAGHGDDHHKPVVRTLPHRPRDRQPTYPHAGYPHSTTFKVTVPTIRIDFGGRSSCGVGRW